MRRAALWQPNDDDWGKYPLHQIGNSHLGFGFSGPMGRIFSVQVAILGTRRVKMGAREVQRLLGRPWSKRYFVQSENSSYRVLFLMTRDSY